MDIQRLTGVPGTPTHVLWSNVTEGRSHTSVAIEQSWSGAIQLEALPVSDEHGHHGSVFALGKDLLGLEVLGGGVAPLQLSPPEQGRLLPGSLCVQPACSDCMIDTMIG